MSNAFYTQNYIIVLKITHTSTVQWINRKGLINMLYYNSWYRRRVVVTDITLIKFFDCLFVCLFIIIFFLIRNYNLNIVSNADSFAILIINA